jgi:hypothetical protein
VFCWFGSATARWLIVLSTLLYLLTGAFWLPVVWMQMRMRDPAAAAHEAGLCRLSTIGCSVLVRLRLPAFAAVLAIFLMIARPRLWPSVVIPALACPGEPAGVAGIHNTVHPALADDGCREQVPA